MATISSPGIGSGLDVNNIITQLLAVERQPLSQLQGEATNLQSQLSTYGQLNSSMAALRDAAAALTSSDTWSQTLATTSDNTTVAVSTTSSAKPGNYSLEIQRLAAAQSNSSITYPSAESLVGEGTLRIELGTWSEDQVNFVSSSALEISVGPPAESLAQLRDKINSANAGITASVLTDANGARLVFRSTATGVANGFRISVNDADANNTDGLGLSALAFDPSAGILTMAQAIAAANAAATLNGIPISSASNTLSNVVDGVSLTLGKLTTAPVQINANQDNTAIRKSLDAFAKAYNDLNTLLTEQTKFNATSGRGGGLQGDSAAVSLRSQMRTVLGATSGASSTFTRVAEVGFDVQRDGSIKINESKLSAGLSNITEMRNLFSNSNITTLSNDGIATRLRRMADQAMGIDGTINTRTQGLQRSIERNTDRQEFLNDQIARVEKRLRLQYSALDTQLGQLNGLQNYINQQFNNNNNNNSG